jgi:quinone-modifying oxidoreductase subunit QmoB
MAKKIGLYICGGCNITDALDIEGLAKIAKKKPKADIIKTHDALCSSEGVELIKNDVQAEGIDGVVIAACSPRAMPEAFDFDPLKLVVDRVNLREHVAWCQKSKEDGKPNEDTQMMAEDYIRMGIVKAQKASVPTPSIEEIDRTILVVGGGITGMNAALESAKAGQKVILVEKEAELGGWMSKWHKLVPRKSPFQEIEENDTKDIIAQVESNENITVYKSANIRRLEGGPGLYEADIKHNGNTETTKIGALVLATGWKPYDPNNLEHLGYGKCHY